MDSAPAESCYRLLYVSTARHFLSPDEIEALLVQSRANNDAASLTGMLVYVDGHFMQYVEGPQAAVEALSQRLDGDRRHHGIIRLLGGPCARRAFPDWSMGYRGLKDDEQERARGLINLAKQTLRGALPADVPEELILFMESFYRHSVELRERDFGRV
ncbi:BLUF domain-containing protein [Pelagibius sp. 7325]|uniref:BLUF domain-containing protein n=1 Tax=Pelagibius sp. 7325 TaxID=3131994 RepID=UPI0030EB2651